MLFGEIATDADSFFKSFEDFANGKLTIWTPYLVLLWALYVCVVYYVEKYYFKEFGIEQYCHVDRKIAFHPRYVGSLVATVLAFAAGYVWGNAVNFNTKTLIIIGVIVVVVAVILDVIRLISGNRINKWVNADFDLGQTKSGKGASAVDDDKKDEEDNCIEQEGKAQTENEIKKSKKEIEEEELQRLRANARRQRKKVNAYRTSYRVVTLILSVYVVLAASFFSAAIRIGVLTAVLFYCSSVLFFAWSNKLAISYKRYINQFDYFNIFVIGKKLYAVIVPNGMIESKRTIGARAYIIKDTNEWIWIYLNLDEIVVDVPEMKKMVRIQADKIGRFAKEEHLNFTYSDSFIEHVCTIGLNRYGWSSLSCHNDKVGVGHLSWTKIAEPDKKDETAKVKVVTRN